MSGADEVEQAADAELVAIVADEESCLTRVLDAMAARYGEHRAAQAEDDYDRDLLELRDEIATARLEDVPPLIEQMERLQRVAARRRENGVSNAVDGRSPYFGHLVLQEDGKRREVLIGRGTLLDAARRVRIVDWRDAPVSRLFYRYEEGDDYEEELGDREVEGSVLVRRSVTIVERELLRITSPQGTFSRRRNAWRRLDAQSTTLRGGQGLATRVEHHGKPGQLGASNGEVREDRHLREITALIDRRQFELITKPDSGLVVIQGGAGSGKTTIGLHRMAYLAFQDRKRFRPDRMLVLVFNDALARYVSMVLPALDVPGVPIRTYGRWARELRQAHLTGLPADHSLDTPPEVVRLKKHPGMLLAIERLVRARASAIEGQLRDALGEPLPPRGPWLLDVWHGSAREPLVHRLHHLRARLGEVGEAIPRRSAAVIEQLVDREIPRARDVLSAWSELLTDRAALTTALAAGGEPFDPADLGRAIEWCAHRTDRLLTELEERAERVESGEGEEPESRRGEGRGPESERLEEAAASGDGDDDDDRRFGVDGRTVTEEIALDAEDDTLLLRLVQRLRGPLVRPGKTREPLVYEHVLVDEAQDLSPVELAVVIDTLSGGRSVTLAGDTAQRLHMDNGFSDWATVLGNLGLSHVAVEPLRLSYRSTAPIVRFARHVLGPLAPDDAPEAVRDGAPVELFRFAQTGDAVAFLAEALRDLSQREPLASVAVIARYAEQADLYHLGLQRSELPHLRRIAAQDFPFRPGIDVTDARQVKGLEFDYVVLVEVSDAGYPDDAESRHLLHIAATRAAHQLWVLTTGRPSSLLPPELLEGDEP